MRSHCHRFTSIVLAALACPALCAEEPSLEIAGRQQAASDYVAPAIAALLLENGAMTNLTGDETTTGRAEIKGSYGLNDQGLLVLTTDDTQMVSSVSLAKDSELKFVLGSAPDGDPGLDFTKG